MVTGDLLKNLLKGKTIAVGAIVSFLISYSLFFGFLCDRQITGFKAYYPFVFILVWAAAFLLCVLLWALIDRINLKVSRKDEKAEEEIGAKKKITLFFVSAVLIFAAWVPCLLASWPGFFSYDASKEFVQIWYPEVPIWGRISIIHSALLLLCCKTGNKLFGDFNSGIALFSIIHMLLGAFVLAYETVFLYSGLYAGIYDRLFGPDLTYATNFDCAQKDGVIELTGFLNRFDLLGDPTSSMETNYYFDITLRFDAATHLPLSVSCSYHDTWQTSAGSAEIEYTSAYEFIDLNATEMPADTHGLSAALGR